MESLTTEQQQELVEIIKEDFGAVMTLDEFNDALLGLLEDMPGFETASQLVISNLTTQLWSQYYE